MVIYKLQSSFTLSVSASARGFKAEVNSFVAKKVVVETKDGETYTGILKGFDDNLNLVLSDANTDTRHYFRILIVGNEVKYVTLKDVPFDLEGLATELSKVFKPNNVRLHEDSGVIIVMDRFKVSEDEVSGEGPVADRIRAIWHSFKEKQG